MTSFTSLVLAVALTVTPGLLAAQTTPQGERLIACFQQVTVPAEYSVKKVKIKDAERKYIRRNGRIELVELAAIFREDKKMIKPAHELMQEVPCN